MTSAASLRDLARTFGPKRLLTGEADLAAYSYDGALDRSSPDAVVLARSEGDVRRAVAWCAANGVPIVARGAGTNLSGGCIPLKGGVILSLARMTRILDVDTAAATACAEPGVVNLHLQEALERAGCFYAPDPASSKVCTLGGNIAENAGGPRCLKYGTTTNHVVAIEVVMPDGESARFSIDDEGPDMLGLMVGAEGTLGVVTRAWVKILPLPAQIATILVGFPSIESSIRCVSAIIAAGIVPRVLEALDKMTVESVEAYKPAGYPKAEAVLLIELDGVKGRVDEEAAVVERLCRRHGAQEYRRATDAAERERLWEGRRGAYAAVARIAPNVLVEDGVVPRGKLPEAYDRVRQIADAHQAKVAMLFHAGDGNLHPNIAFDERNAEETRRVKRAGFEILRACVELGGSLSGEHGIGSDKRAAMAWLFSPETIALFRRLKAAFDPQGLCNPEKVIPLPSEEDAARELRPARRPLTAAAQELAAKMRDAAATGARVLVAGAGTRHAAAAAPGDVILATTALKSIVELDRSNYTLTVEAGVEPKVLKAQLLDKGFHLPLPAAGGTLGGFLATKAWAGVRDHVLGMRVLLASGEHVDLGGKVVKNVSGYDVPKALIGSWGAFGVIVEVTLKLHAAPLSIPAEPPAPRPFTPDRWHRKLKSAFDPQNRLNAWVFGR
ncbi:MAG: FAD-binding protein [Elusimicrobia bacterium]|nr:FAD-binding protein [Elusimicrobiota bacterium]